MVETQEAANTKTVQDCFAAFGRGDVQTIINNLADDVRWQPVKGAGANVPHAGERRGKAAIGDFFSKVAAHVNFTKFEPREFIAQGDQVAVVGYYEGTTSAKKGFKSDWVMVFTLKNGKVAAFREFTDSAALNASF